MINEGDSREEVARKLADRFGSVADRTIDLMGVFAPGEPLGRPAANWHDDLVSMIDARIAHGESVSSAVRAIEDTFCARFNVTPAYLRTIYYDNKRRERDGALDNFYAMLMDGNFAPAADQWFLLTTKQRQSVISAFF